DAVEKWGRDTLVTFFAGGHYRQPIQYDDDTLSSARARAERIREAARRLVDGDSPADLAVHRDAFFAALADDFNTPAAPAPRAAADPPSTAAPRCRRRGGPGAGACTRSSRPRARPRSSRARRSSPPTSCSS